MTDDTDIPEAEPPEGIYTEIPMEQYHQMGGTSSSELKPWLKSPAHGVEDRRTPDEWKPSYDRGSLLHDGLLGGDELEHDYVWYDSTKTRNTKTYRQECREQDVIGIMPDDVRLIQCAREWLEKSDLIDPEWSGGGHAEITFVWREPETGRIVKVRPDYLVEQPHRIHITDVKSVRSRYEDPKDFDTQIAKRDYELSGAMYCDVVEALTGKPVTYRWLTIGKKPPHAPGVIQFDVDDRGVGQRAWKAALKLMDAYDRGEIDAETYQTEPRTSDLPAWKRHEVNRKVKQIEERLK